MCVVRGGKGSRKCSRRRHNFFVEWVGGATFCNLIFLLGSSSSSPQIFWRAGGRSETILQLHFPTGVVVAHLVAGGVGGIILQPYGGVGVRSSETDFI